MEDSPPDLPPRTRKGDLATSLRQLYDCKYYWGQLSRDEAEQKLAKQSDGVFLLRDSSDEHHFFSLSFRMHDRTHHVRVTYSGGMFYFENVLNGRLKKPTIMDLIHNTMMQSINNELQYFIIPRTPHEAPLPVNLSFPISRDCMVYSLKHLARLTIRTNVRLDLIDQLELPDTLLEYLREGQYYVENPKQAYPQGRNRPALPPRRRQSLQHGPPLPPARRSSLFQSTPR